MGTNGKTKLKNADICKVDFVPAGAQQHSRISLFKSADTPNIISKIGEAIAKVIASFLPIEGVEKMEESVIEAVLTPAEPTVEAVEIEKVEPEPTEVEKTEPEVEEVKEVEEIKVEEPIEESVKEPKEVEKIEPVVIEPEDIMKGLPEAVIKMLAEKDEQNKQLSEQIAKINDEALTKEYIAKAATITTNIGIPAEELGAVLKSINALSPELASKVENVIKVANETAAKGEIFKELGNEPVANSFAVDSKDAWARIEVLASNLVAKSEDGLTKAMAITKVLESPEGRKLYAVYNKEFK